MKSEENETESESSEKGSLMNRLIRKRRDDDKSEEKSESESSLDWSSDSLSRLSSLNLHLLRQQAMTPDLSSDDSWNDDDDISEEEELDIEKMAAAFQEFHLGRDFAEVGQMAELVPKPDRYHYPLLVATVPKNDDSWSVGHVWNIVNLAAAEIHRQEICDKSFVAIRKAVIHNVLKPLNGESSDDDDEPVRNAEGIVTPEAQTAWFKKMVA